MFLHYKTQLEGRYRAVSVLSSQFFVPTNTKHRRFTASTRRICRIELLKLEHLRPDGFELK
jgi:hypothetical protein